MKKIWIVAACVLSVLAVLAGLYLHRHSFIKELAVGMFELAVNDPTPKWKEVRSPDSSLNFSSPFPFQWETKTNKSRSGKTFTTVTGRSAFNRSQFMISTHYTEFARADRPADMSKRFAEELDYLSKSPTTGWSYQWEPVTCSGYPATMVTVRNTAPPNRLENQYIVVTQEGRIWRIHAYPDPTKAEQKDWISRVFGSIRIRVSEDNAPE